MKDMNEYIEQSLRAEPAIKTSFSVGDEVNFINDYGIVFQDLKVIGFSEPDASRDNAHIHLDKESYWFALGENSIFKKDNLKPFHRIYSPSKGYLGLDEYKDFTWVINPADAELFSKKTRDDVSAQKFTPDVKDASYVYAEGCKPHKTKNASRVLQLMDSYEDGQDRYQEFVKLVASEADVSIESLEAELDPFI